MKFTGERFVPTESLDLDLEIEHLHRYYSMTDLVKNKIVVDAACGEGYGSYLLAHHAALVHGVDISEEAIYHAKNKYKRANLTFGVDSIASLPFENNSIDVLISFETIEHVNEELQSAFLNEIKRVLKHDGILVMSTPNKLIYSDIPQYKNQFHVKEFYREEFVCFLEKNFNNVNIFEQDFQVISMINNKDEQAFKKMPFKKQAEDIGKYLIAVCSNVNISNISIGSIVLDEDNKLQKSSKRIIQLQTEEEDRNIHIQRLDREIDGKNIIIEEKSSIIIERDRVITEKDRVITEKDRVIVERDNMIAERESVIAERDNIIDARNQEIDDKNIKIYNLESKEQILNTILQSNGWRFLKKYYHIRDGILPIDTKRRLFSKLLLKFMRNPSLYCRFISLENIKKAIYYIKTEDLSRLNSRVEEYSNRHTVIKKDEVKLFVSPDVLNKIIFKKVSEPLVSIIIPVYNQWSYTYSCLKAIVENTSNVSYEIIIADDVSDDETSNIREYVENITVIRNDKNVGFLLNCNNAAKEARGKYILFLNNDTNVQVDWLKNLIDLAESDESIGMVGSKLVYADGKLQEAGGIVWKDASGWNYGRLDDPEKSEYNYVKEVDYISGASIMIKKSVWDEIGGFDERYAPAYFEDADLAFEVRKHGYKVMYQPKSTVVHFEGISNGTDINNGAKAYQVKNQKKFYDKWKLILEENHYANATNVFIARDRSKNKKCILVIDHYVPQYDKDAGSRTIFQYLKLLCQMGYNVKFIGDDFFPHQPYTLELEQMGVEVLYGSGYFNNWKKWLKENEQYFECVFLNRPHIAVKYIDEIKKYMHAKIIYNVCDLHFLREEREYNITKDPTILKSAQRWKNIEFGIMNKSDTVFTLSTDERDIINRLLETPKAVIAPIFLYDNFNDSELNIRTKKDMMFVGGFNHKPNVDGVKWFIEYVWPLISKQIPDVKFYIVGSNAPPEIRALSSDEIVIKGFISDSELSELYQSCRICIVPLRFGAGVKGKTIEAMYNKIPIVSTAIGIEGLSNIKDCITAYDDPQEFADEVIRLYSNEVMMKKCITQNFNYVKNNFSTDQAKELFKVIFTNEKREPSE